MHKLETLQTCEPHLSRLDTQLAYFLTQRSRLAEVDKPEFEALVQALNHALSNGHSCIRVEPAQAELLHRSELVSTNGRTPLILQDSRLYLRRYWQYETRLVRRLLSMLNASRLQAEIDQAELETRLAAFFPSVDDRPNPIDWQKEAARLALNSRFCMITGGPGTGKTTTVVKILALLQMLSEDPLQIALAAPTGKAAMRLQESIGASKSQLPCSQSIRDRIPESVSTLHRLLKPVLNSPYFRYNREQLLPHDVVIVDEASMVDLALMTKLIDALKPEARLILLGDADQLASVESGAVLADLTRALPGCTGELKHFFRFNSSIKTLAEAVNRQQNIKAWVLLKKDNASQTLGFMNDHWLEMSVERQFAYLDLIASGADYSQIYQSFQDFQVLCAVRQGRFGVEGVNQQIEHQLRIRQRIRKMGCWYIGRPVMVLQNDASQQLYNGDMGICLPDPYNETHIKVFFQRPDGSVRQYLPARLPLCETVFAMTIHKSQGSEFNDVLIVLPERVNPVLSKELLYTGITRARKSVRLVASASVFHQAVKQRIMRSGGLLEQVQSSKELTAG